MSDLWQQSSFDDIISWISANSKFLLNNSYWRECRPKCKDFRVNITYLDVRWSDAVSNTHSCPRGGVTNWCWSDNNNLAKGYPGWDGRIEFQMSHDIGFGSDILYNTGIHTGTGGGISKNRFGYDVRFYAADWPRLHESTVLGRLIEDDGWKRYKYGTPVFFA